MFFRNLTLFRFSSEAARDLADHLATSLDEHRLLPPGDVGGIGALELSRAGFVPPVGDGIAPLTYQQKTYIAFCAATDAKILPVAVVNDELRRRCNAVAEKEGRRVGPRERKRLKEALFAELLPRAFVRRTTVRGYVDTQNGWLVIDTASRSKAEEVINQLREALGSFPALPLAPETFARGLLTAWLSTSANNSRLPDCLHLGSDVELIDRAAATSKLIGRNVDLAGEDIMEALRGGSEVARLGLNLEDRITFVLAEDLVVRKLRLTDIALDDMGEDFENSEDEARAKFSLLTGEVAKLLVRLTELFAIPRPDSNDPLKLDREDAPAAMVKADRVRRNASRCAADILGYHVSVPTRRPIPHCPQPDQGNAGEVEA